MTKLQLYEIRTTIWLVGFLVVQPAIPALLLFIGTMYNLYMVYKETENEENIGA